MTVEPRASQMEQDQYTLIDTTALQVFTATNVNTGATVNSTIINVDSYNRYMFYIDSSSVTTVAAGMTGLEVTFQTRANSAAAWIGMGTQSGVAAESGTLMKIEGTGGYTSGVVPIRDLRIVVKNVSGSATATLNGYVVMSHA